MDDNLETNLKSDAFKSLSYIDKKRHPFITKSLENAYNPHIFLISFHPTFSFPLSTLVLPVLSQRSHGVHLKSKINDYLSYMVKTWHLHTECQNDTGRKCKRSVFAVKPRTNTKTWGSLEIMAHLRITE